MKMPIPSYEFLRNKAVDLELNKCTHGVVLGHNRHATVGAHTYENTHPFLCNNVVGAHNGTVDSPNRSDLPVKGTWGTDSETIMHNLSAYSAKEIIPKMTASNRGAWCFVWYDFRDGSINLLRNQERPLYYAFNKEGDQLFWSSEAGILRGAAANAEVPLETRKGSTATIVRQLPVDTHLTWVVPGPGQKFGEITRSKIAGKKFVAPPARTNTRVGTITRGAGTINNRANNTINNSSAALPSSLDLLLHPYDWSTGDVVDLFGQENLKGCSWCTKPVTKASIRLDQSIMLSRDTVICVSCKGRAEIAKPLHIHARNKIAQKVKEQ
jgi:hypothetical protein